MLAPQPIRLLAIDIDGTLLDPHKRLTSRTREAIRAAQDAGVMVTLATARRYNNSRQFADELDLAIPLITYDGALVIEHPQGTILHMTQLAAEVAQQATEIIARHGLQPIVHHHFVETGEETWAAQEELDHPELQPYLAQYTRIRRFAYSGLCIEQPAPLRVVAFATPEHIARLLPEISELDCAWYTIKRGNYGCGEIVVTSHHCTKATGLSMLAQRLGIPLEQVMAIGDNINDIEMLQAAGWGVAMGHAPDMVKTAAQAVTGSHHEDGAAQAIERYILMQDRISG